MAQLLHDSIDFSEYMAETDAEHKVRKASAYESDVVAYFHDKTHHKSAHLPWGKAKELIGFRPGEVSLWGGMNGHGKSMVLGQACTGFARQQQIVVIASMEMRPVITVARMCRQEYGRTPSVEAIAHFHKWTDPYLYVYDQLGAVKAERMLAVIRYCADVLHADHFVIDSLLKCGIGEDDYNAQKHFIDQLCAIGRDSGMHIHLVAHSRKAKDEFSPPGKMDVKGTGSITDQVDNVITVWRNKRKEADIAKGMPSDSPCCLLICDKQRNGEWEGQIGLWFDRESFAFHETDRF